MPRVLLGQAFAQEDVAEMTAAIGAFDLDSAAIGIGQARHGAFDLLIERRPAAVRVELVVRAIELGVAATASAGGTSLGHRAAGRRAP